MCVFHFYLLPLKWVGVVLNESRESGQKEASLHDLPPLSILFFFPETRIGCIKLRGIISFLLLDAALLGQIMFILFVVFFSSASFGPAFVGLWIVVLLQLTGLTAGNTHSNESQTSSFFFVVVVIVIVFDVHRTLRLEAVVSRCISVLP